MELEVDNTDYGDYSDYADIDDNTESEFLKRTDSMMNEAQHPSGAGSDILFQRTNAYYIMDSTRTEKYIEEMVSDLRDTWGIPDSVALRLLKKFAWEKNKALNSLTEECNLDTMEIINSGPQQEFDCQICFTTENIKDGYSFGCSHYYCKDCFKEFLSVAITEGNILASCPTDKCPEILTPKLVASIFPRDSEMYQKYKRFYIKTIVETSQNLLWCPGTGCTNIIQLLKMTKNERILLNIRCPCGHCFCFECRDMAHRPLDCSKFAKWMGLVGGKDDSLNSGWIQKNSKQCPKCKINIEKNQGCMHMTCRNCGHHFCWLCLENWKQHGIETGGFYNCNKFKETEKVMNDEEREFEKFNFYRDRFEEHWNSIKHAIRKKKVILENFQALSFEVVTAKDDSFLKEALDLIIEARRAITMTYAAGYFRKFSKMQKEIYEIQQSLLWEALDNLDRYTDQLMVLENMEDQIIDTIQIEKHLAKKFNDFKIHLNSRTGGVITACNKLLKCMEEENEIEKKIENQVQMAKKQEEDFMREAGLTSLHEEPHSVYSTEFWFCAFCTFENQPHMDRCEMCDSEKTVHEGQIF